MIKKISTLLLLILLIIIPFISNIDATATDLPAKVDSKEAKTLARQQFDSHVRSLYKQCGLAGKLDYEVFQAAMTGYLNMSRQGVLKNKNIITVIDFQKPSTEKRLFVIDLAAHKILFNTYTSHGRNTGDNIANNFSNQPESNKSSVGFYVTAETYHGKHGYSLRLDGMDASFNDKARDRAIVVHGADYVSEAFIKKYGRLGRSLGCPALPQDLSPKIIDVIKEGSLLFLYHKNQDYLASSKHLNLDAALMNLAMLSSILPVKAI